MLTKIWNAIVSLFSTEHKVRSCDIPRGKTPSDDPYLDAIMNDYKD